MRFFLKLAAEMKLKSSEEKAFDGVLAGILKARRDELNVSQEFISSRSGVSRITIGKWERGAKTPISFDLYNVLRVLYKDPSEFWSAVHKQCIEKLLPLEQAAEKEKFWNYIKQTRKKMDKDS